MSGTKHEVDRNWTASEHKEDRKCSSGTVLQNVQFAALKEREYFWKF